MAENAGKFLFELGEFVVGLSIFTIEWDFLLLQQGDGRGLSPLQSELKHVLSRVAQKRQRREAAGLRAKRLAHLSNACLRG